MLTDVNPPGALASPTGFGGVKVVSGPKFAVDDKTPLISVSIVKEYEAETSRPVIVVFLLGPRV